MPPQQRPLIKKILPPLIACVLLAGLIVLGVKTSNTPTTIPTKEVPLVEWPSEQVKRETITDSSKGYEITAYYPITKSDSITGLLKNFVTDQITMFKTDTSEGGALPEGYRPMTLDISYEEYRNASANTYVFLTYSDTGGAHGLSVTTTFSFTKTGQRIALADLFTNGIRGLGILADVVKKELMKRDFADADWINEGAGPREENYQNFIVQEDGVLFIFDQYQVAPYAAGVQEVFVPVTAFQSIANPEIF